jgi:hypothetical protein
VKNVPLGTPFDEAGDRHTKLNGQLIENFGSTVTRRSKLITPVEAARKVAFFLVPRNLKWL